MHISVRCAAPLALVMLTVACGRLTSKGEWADTTARVRMVQEVDGEVGLRGTGVVDFSRDELLLAVKSPARDAPVETRYFGTTGYFQVDGGRWATDGVVDGAPGSATLALLHGASDPRKGLAYLRGLDPATRRVGSSDVRGSSTTHYHSTVEARPIDGTSRTFGVDLWVDSKGRALRLRLQERQTLTYDFSDFGVKADVKRPSLNEMK